MLDTKMLDTTFDDMAEACFAEARVVGREPEVAVMANRGLTFRKRKRLEINYHFNQPVGLVVARQVTREVALCMTKDESTA